MKVSSIKNPMNVQLQIQPVPESLQEDEVLIRIKRVGICGSDVHIYQGHNPFATYPRVWGHEFAGEIAAVGSGVQELAVGDHVVGEPYLNCQTCYACKEGRGNVCNNLQVFGVHLDGGAREYMVLPQRKVFKVDKAVPWNIAVLAEPMTIGFQSVHRGRVKPGDIVLVMGSGTIGVTVMMAAKYVGATVICTDILDEKLQYARRMGADYVINVREEDQDARVKELTGGTGPNVIFDCVCNKTSLEWAVEAVSPAGRVVELGFGPITSEIPHVTIMKKEVDVCGTRLQAGKFSQAIDFLEKNCGMLADFVTQVFPLEKVTEAFAFATENPKLVRKIVIEVDDHE